MASKIVEKMNWHRLHHLYLGLAGMIVSGFVGFKYVHDKDLLHIGPCILAGFLSALWAADDWFYHMFGIHTPCWYAEQALLKIGWYAKLRDWLNKFFGGAMANFITKNNRTGETHTAVPIMWVGAIGGALCLIADPILEAVWGIHVNLTGVAMTLFGMAGVAVGSMALKK